MHIRNPAQFIIRIRISFMMSLIMTLLVFSERKREFPQGTEPELKPNAYGFTVPASGSAERAPGRAPRAPALSSL